MLIRCPECELQVSDKAHSCPHCGYPLKSNMSRTYKSNKRKRLPNGFGQISEIKNRNLRKPFRAMISVGKYDTGRPIVKPLKPESYFETYNDAYTALVEYNKDPYELESSITMKELYDRWTEQYFKSLSSDSSVRTIKAAWSRCSAVYNIEVRNIRVRHVKAVIEASELPNMRLRIKSVLNQMLDYAVEYEIVDRNVARMLKISDETTGSKKDHIAFTEEEMDRLWKYVGTVAYADLVIIQCYTGFRPQELIELKTCNVDLDTGLITGGMKTEAGTNRVVPIHPRIRPLVINRIEEALKLGSEYVFNCTETHTNRKLTYDKYQYRFKKIVEELNLNPNHRPHDPRKHFATMAKRASMDEYAIKYIMGHAITDITESVYTERDPQWLIAEMQKIK